MISWPTVTNDITRFTVSVIGSGKLAPTLGPNP